MALCKCLAKFLLGRKKRSNDCLKNADITKGRGSGNTRTKNENLVKLSNDYIGEENNFDASVTFGSEEKRSSCGVEVMGESSKNTAVDCEAAYEGSDKHEEILSLKRDVPDSDLKALAVDDYLTFPGFVGKSQELGSHVVENKFGREDRATSPAQNLNGHLSDPGMGLNTEFWGSPMLNRSCSNIETRIGSLWKMFSIKSQSYSDFQNLSGNTEGTLEGFRSSPESVMTNCSADRILLKKCSSSQVLPSRSRKLWWKLFLWSHRNLHKPNVMNSQMLAFVHDDSKQKGGYSSDTYEQSNPVDRENTKAIKESRNKSPTNMWQSQWVALSAESSLDRVSTWVNNLQVNPPFLVIEHDEDDHNGDGTSAIVFPRSPKIGQPSGKNYSNASRRIVEEVMQANDITRSLNSFSSGAHITNMGLKVIPMISAFSSLRSVNLSGNLIVHITRGSLPKSLHTLDLSRNKIVAIEGLRDLTRLRVVNLSYNRISHIGHGLSTCTLIKELNLAGNKISDVEGLHRLLKLALLDLSFNKITTGKSLGQLAANCKSLLALNLLGNPIHSNIGDDRLRKAVTSLLPRLAYLNKQPIKSPRTAEVATDSIAKVAFGSGRLNYRKKSTRMASQGPTSSIKVRVGSEYRGLGIGQKSGRHRSKNLQQPSSSGRLLV